MELVLSVIGLLLAVGIAGWEYRRANRAEAALAKAFKELPLRLVSDLSRMIAPQGQGAPATQEIPGLVTQFADLNGDGKSEMLVSYLSGPHNTSLQVFGMKSDWEFGLLGEIIGQTPTDFDLEDIDGDGIPEVSVVEIAKAPDLPYVMGLRDRVTYKLGNSGFVEVKRVKGYTAEDLRIALAEWHQNDA
ncbi:MAG: hypothetical protein DDT39_01674 [Firmicutes bacterium]|nr:hypothetical protein [candidate division NPL-UPA2 bacterium]